MTAPMDDGTGAADETVGAPTPERTARRELFSERDDDVTSDLIRKLQADLSDLLLRALAISPPPRLPILLTAAAVTLGMTAAELDGLSEAPSGGPEPKTMMLAALLAARSGIDPADPVGMAYRDLEILKDAGRVPEVRAPLANSGPRR